MLYFAYGSNLSHAQLTKRCPSAIFVSSAILREYELIFSGYSPRWRSSVANIQVAKNGIVEGGLFEMNQKDLNHLAELEGSQGYLPISVNIEQDKQIFLADTFISADNNLGKPSKEYITTMRAGFSDCSISTDYTDSIPA